MARQQPMPLRASRLRQYRKAAFLAQREFAALVGLATQQAFSELESGAKRPGIEVAIACAVVSGVPLREVFPKLAFRIEQKMLDRARALHEELKRDKSRAESAAYVAALISRLTDHHAS